ncbi:MAG: hypothetical protein ABEJ23_00380 [Haloarculaceae archaeon]
MHEDDSRSRRALQRLDRRTVLASLGGGVAALAGCSSRSPAANQSDTPTATPAETATDLAPLQVTPEEGVVGDEVTVAGQGLPSNATLELAWERVEGRWAIAKHSEIVGPQYTTSSEAVAEVQTDGDGTFSTTITVPEDYGGDHTIHARRDGSALARGTFTVRPSFELDRTSAPLGERFTVTGHGIGWGTYRRNDQVIWDNGFTGLFTAVTNRGTARAKVTAAGPPGTHVLEIGGGYGGISYLNPQQSPYPRDFRYASWTVEVTDPEDPVRQWRRPSGSESPVTGFYPDLDRQQGSLSVTPTSGSVGSTAIVSGQGLPADESVRLQWLTMTGSRVSGNGYSSTAKDLLTVETDGQGRFETDFEVPDDLGGTHPIVATVGEKSVAAAGFVVRPSVVSFGPTEGPEGTPIDVHLKGVGWTAYDNTYTYVYNNDYVGYACGFNTNGDVQVQLRAAGEPGLHTITLYPALYKKPNEDRETNMYMKPQLTYLDDHPVRPLPSFQFLFRMTE